MSEPADFNIDNYSIKDLLTIFEIKKPMSKAELTEFMNEKIKIYEEKNQEKYANFFSDGLDTLLEHNTQMNQILLGLAPQTTAKNFGENVFQNEYYASNDMMNNAARNMPNRQSNTTIVNNNHSVQAARRLFVPSVHNPSLLQGNMNPIMQNTYITTVNIDSHYREIRKDTGSTSCTFNVESVKVNIADSSTDFTITLSEPITNVVAMTVGTIEIPMNAYYPFSEQYGTTSFDVSMNGVNHCIEIDPGFYPVPPSQSRDVSGIGEVIENEFIKAGLSGLRQKLYSGADGVNLPPQGFDVSGWLANKGIDPSYNLDFSGCELPLGGNNSTSSCAFMPGSWRSNPDVGWAPQPGFKVAQFQWWGQGHLGSPPVAAQIGSGVQAYATGTIMSRGDNNTTIIVAVDKGSKPFIGASDNSGTLPTDMPTYPPAPFGIPFDGSGTSVTAGGVTIPGPGYPSLQALIAPLPTLLTPPGVLPPLIGDPSRVALINPYRYLHYAEHIPPDNHLIIHIDPITQKTRFSSTTHFDLIFYPENDCKTDCSNNNCFKDNTGKKIDSNLGWLLGFRQPKYLNITNISSEAIVNPWGTRYLILEVDDFNKNRNTGNLISMTDHQTKFNLPSYYNKTRQSYPACPAPCDSSGINFQPAKYDGAGVQITRPCRRGTPANTPLIDGSNNLTTAQKYTITEILNARKTIAQDRYFSPVTSNVLYRFPVQRNNLNMLEGTAAPTIIKNELGMANARRYFGPVTIKTLKVRLLNDKGRVLDLNNMDFSFSLLVERLYQY